jgi:hypothetical protein
MSNNERYQMMRLTKKEYNLAFASLIYGFFLTFLLVTRFMARYAPVADPAFDRPYPWQFFYLFTFQNNMLVALWLWLFGLSSFFGWTKIYQFVTKKIVLITLTVNIAIVFLIVLFVLNPVFQGQWDPFESSSEIITHNATPIFMFFMFFLIRGNGTLKNIHALYVLIYPFVYFIIHTIIGSTLFFRNGNPAFNYGFINPANYPNIFVFMIVFVLLVAIFGAFGWVLIQFKKFLEENYYNQ